MTAKGTARAKRPGAGGVKSPERPPEPSDPARARVLRAERVAHVMTMMRGGTWKGVRSWRALAAKWGVSTHAIESYAREASAVIAHLADPEALKGELLAEANEVRRIALARKRVVNLGQGVSDTFADPDCKAALAATDLKAKVLGVVIARSSTTVTTVDASSLSPRERVAQLRELRQSVEDELAAEEARMAAEERGDELQ